MRIGLSFLILTAGLAIPGAAEPLPQGDRDFAMSYLHATRKQFLDAIANVSEAQWKFKASPEKWSIAECAEHITESENFLFEVASVQVMKTPAKTDVQRTDLRVKDEAIIKGVTDRSQKAQAPEPLKPTNRWPTKEAAMEEFKKRRDRTIEWIKTTPEDLRAHTMKSPAGELDAYQWTLLLAAHSERHTKQIKEVIADPAYPKK
jgi:hypothetical protein